MMNSLENCVFCADLPQKHRFEIRPLGQICLKTIASTQQNLYLNELVVLLKSDDPTKADLVSVDFPREEFEVHFKNVPVIMNLTISLL